MARERVPAEQKARSNQHGGGASDGASARAEASADAVPDTPRTTANDLPFLEGVRQRSESAEQLSPNEQDLDSAPPSIPSAASLSADSLHSNEVLSEPPARQLNSVLPGHVIAGRYLVRSVLGEGGMGIVYCCRDQATDEDVALKRVILPEGQLAEEYLMWFYKEARALAALDHPSIVRARDFGQLMDGSPYLVMDLAAGLSLHDLAQARMNFPLVWSIVDQILSALAHAHARGIIHGDLKPSNVLVERIDGHPPLVRVLDFGLAWLKQDPHDERLDGEKAMEFLPHAGAGTPGYMAPEQIQHEMHNVCGATDLYALGCILYKALSGRSPFAGNSKELLRVHAFEPAPELKPVGAVPDGVASFVMRLLAKRPWERFEYVAEARAVWAEWRPSGDPEGFEFPKLPRARQIQLAPFDETEIDRSKPLREAPELAAVAERAPGLLSIRPSPLVGQHDVKKELREICDDVIDGEGAPHRLVLLVGPAGAGKSRIAEWLCEVVHEEGTMVPLRSRYRAVRGPLDGMLGAVTHYFNFERTDRDTIESTLLSRWNVAPGDKNARTWVAGAAEWLRPRPPSLDQPLGPSGMRFALDTLEVRRMVIRYTLRKIANGRPLLFVLDDLHHAGQATFEGLLKIHSDEPDQRIVMVATVRAEDVHLGTPAAERLRHLRERMNGAVIEVSPMDTETTCQLIRRSLPLDDAAVLEAARRSRGNPLFALQQLHAWALAGNMEFSRGIYRVPQEVLAVRPQTTAELWDSRVAALPDQHRLAAYAVATLGGDMRREVVHHFLQSLGLSADAALTSLQNAEILIPRGGGRYSWPHALLQEHLAARLEQRRDRRRIYRLAADALRIHPLSNTRRVVRQRVVNLLKGSEPEAAANLLFEFLEHGWIGTREPLATLLDLELLKGRLNGLAFALKNRWQAEALRHVGRNDEARQHAETARDAFEELGDRENLAHVLRVLGHLKSEQAESQDGRTLVMQALEIFRELDHTLGQAQCEAVIGEIDYLLGDYESATAMIQAGEEHFAALDQPLGRGQCLLLLSWIAHSGGETERSRKLTLEARGEFERAGYRLGTAQADASLAHVEHRLMNYYSAELGAEDALLAFETLHTPRGQAACERLLAMIGIDTDDPDMAELHAKRAITLYEAIGDPWGILEAKLLRCQIALAQRQFGEARKLLNECHSVVVQEAEPRQHYLLTLSWLCAAEGVFDAAVEHLEAASEVFGARTRAGDHTPHLLGRLARLEWPGHAMDRIHAWRALLTDRSRRKAT